MGKNFSVTIDGRPFSVKEGTTVAAAILNAELSTVRRSVSGARRGPLCGMGICFECRATVDGVAHQRSCMIACAEGMVIATDA